MGFDKVLFKHEEPHGPGDVYFIWQKGPTGSLLASTGGDGTVAIFNRQGFLMERIVLQGLCSGFSWDCDGDLLAIITNNSSQVTIWDSNSHKKQIIETGLRDSLSCVMWAKQSQLMAVGTSRGNLSIYNHHTSKRIPILGKHSKRILCGAWSMQNLLALGSDDKSFSLSNEEGDSLRVVPLRDVPSDMYFAEMRTEDRVPGEENTVSMIIGKRTLFLYYLPEPDSPTELGFQSRYGSLVQHKWFGDGYILLGFSNGNLVAISTNLKDIGQELWQVKNHRDILTGVAYCPPLDIVASCGDNTIKIHSITNLQETEKIITLPDQSGVQMIDWSSDGQLMAVTTTHGSICTFVTKLQIIYAVSAPRIAILSSLAEVSIYSLTNDRKNKVPIKLNLEVEPSFIAIGPFHLAAGMNNHVWFYDLGRTLGESPMLLGDREFISEIKEVQINSDFCAALCTGHLILQSIETDNPNTKNKTTQSFPDAISGLSDAVITCHLLTNEFLIFATDLGYIIFFSLEQWTVCVKYQHTMGIKSIQADLEGTKLIFIDDHMQGFVFLASSEESTLIIDFPKKCEGVIWDILQPNIFIAFDNKVCTTYSFMRYSIEGKHTIKIGETKLISGQIPLLLYDGDLSLCTESGTLSNLTLTTHLVTPGQDSKDQFKILVQLKKYYESFKLCDNVIKDASVWLELGRKAISDLDIDFALKVYHHIGDASMVFALQEIKYIEDLNMLCGFCALLLDRSEEAKAFFAKSSNPQEALELCRDLLQWEQAMILANSLAPEQVPFIAREYAQQLEFTGSYSEALYHYEKGFKEDFIYSSNNTISSSPEMEEHIKLCKSGIARTSIKTGDFRRGIQYALELNDPQLLHDCADSLATVGHLTEAAGLLEKGKFWDESCSFYIQLKMWTKVNQLLPQVTSTKLHAVYAKAKESEGHFNEAISSYRIAGDLDAVVRIYLEHMSDPHPASEIVLESRSTESAKLLAKFYQRIGDIEQALQFLVLCGCIQEAFALAQRHNKLKHYGELLEQYENAKSSDFLALAHYFENEKYTLLAGKYYFLAREFSKALKYLLKASSFSNEESQALSLAIDCVATSNNEQLSNQLIEFLLGDIDGSPKDPKYLFRLYMARKHFKDAAKTAVVIANQEQISGNYRSAHDLLFSMYQELRRNNLSIASDMRHNLILLHRYTLVRIHVRLGNHLLASKLLVQVAANISQFPAHIVPILTSTVIECHRAGLKKSAFTYASMLMRPEYRNQIDPKYAKKVESIVRKAPRGIKEFKDNIEDETMECPICSADLPIMEVTCYQCKTTLPICIATGQHIIKENMTACPECDFLCFRSEMEKILTEGNLCPMCGETVDSNRLMDVEDIRPYILSST
ncbi:WD repeat-containing protein 19 [Condylostylus longicornis]|uniref:WD repeat-containing protein 19 n=1 Tax=Condylostylus longicornis TaxID=2530218 RepID=UPI00244E00E4|nr:WD repeat-containing protein 19 [Condylostylus longicornis]